MLSIIPAQIFISSLCNKIFSRLTATFSSKFPSYSLPLFPLGPRAFLAAVAIFSRVCVVSECVCVCAPEPSATVLHVN